MRKIATDTRNATEDLERDGQLQAQTNHKVVQLEHYRAERLGESVSAIRNRLGELQRSRIQAELSAGRLLRELAALQRELRECRERMAQCHLID